MSVSLSVMADFKWPVPEETRLYNGVLGEGMKFRPFDKAMTQQNPPDFSWPRAVDYTNVKYHLVISDKEDMSNIVYEVKDLDINIYNFPHTFEKKTYYWQVSYTCDEGKSEWSDVRRFTIREDATDFVVPKDLSEVIKNINMEHPRLFNIEKVREVANYRKDTYNAIRNTVRDAIKAGVHLRKAAGQVHKGTLAHGLQCQAQSNAAAGGITAAIVAGLIASFLFKAKDKS